MIERLRASDREIAGAVAEVGDELFGPHAGGIHRVGERVFLPSVVQTAQVLALLVRDWCGLA